MYRNDLLSSIFISGYLIFANMRFRQSYFSPIGEYQLAFRQLANIVLTFANWRICYGETKIYWRISARHSPIGEYRADIRHWRMYRWRNAILAKLHRLLYILSYSLRHHS
jgi:hypothetical protein